MLMSTDRLESERLGGGEGDGVRHVDVRLPRGRHQVVDGLVGRRLELEHAAYL